MGAIEWLPDSALPSKVIPLTMTYRYKRDPNGKLIERKARCAGRSDLMKANVHYGPAHTAAHLSQKLFVRLLFALSVRYGLQLEHLHLFCLPS